jgi:CheY-like chemotaxis protein
MAALNKSEAMLRIVLASARLKDLQAFAEALASDPEVQLTTVPSGGEALEAAQDSAPHLVIIDSELPDISTLDLIRRLIRLNAMVNTAVLSPLSEEGFHEASEGLGVLGRLPAAPGADAAAELLAKLRLVLGGVG